MPTMEATSSIERVYECLASASDALNVIEIVLTNKIKKYAGENPALVGDLVTLVHLLDDAEEMHLKIHDMKSDLNTHFRWNKVTNCCGVRALDDGHGYARCPKCKEMAMLEPEHSEEVAQ